MGALSRTLSISIGALTILALVAVAPAQAQRQTAPASIDDLLLSVSGRVPSFGGMYLDANGRLAIWLTDTAQLPAAKSAIAAVFGRSRVDVTTARALRARYTFAQLKSWHDQHRLTTLALRGVVLAGIHKAANRLEVGVESASVIPSVQAVLTRGAIPADAVEIVVMEPIRPWDALTDTHRPLVGGLLINNSCTLGFLAVLSGQAGFVTCSHCTNVQGGVEGTIFHQAVLNGDVNRVGLEIVDPPYLASPGCPGGRVCRFSDAAFIERSGGPNRETPRAQADFGRIALPDTAFNIVGEFEIVGQEPTPIDGEILAKVGWHSGLTGGTISMTCTDINNLASTNKTQLCQDLVEETDGPPGGPGDSGSVVFSETGVPQSSLPPATLYGLLWGGNSTSWAFSPISAIDLELGKLRTSMVESGANSPPEVIIRQPQDFAPVGVGGLNFVPFQADIVDYEGCCQDVTWSSNKDGVMGHGANLDFTFQSTGARTVTVTVTDNQGGVASDSIEVIAGGTPPSVTIVKPTAGQTLYAGVPYVFQGSSFDPNEPFLAIPCSTLTWSSTKATDPLPVTGCNPTVTFTTLGARTISFSGTDNLGFAALASVAIDVTTAPVNGPPSVTILNPIDDANLQASTAVTLKGQVQDPNNASPIAYQWLLDDGATTTVLSTGSVANGGQPTLQWTPSANVPFHCGGEGMTITLSATNPSNQTGKASVAVRVAYPTC